MISATAVVDTPSIASIDDMSIDLSRKVEDAKLNYLLVLNGVICLTLSTVRTPVGVLEIQIYRDNWMTYK